LSQPTFFLGTHMPHWLRSSTVPLFIADTRLRRYRKLPTARSPWAADSGGFTQLQRHGRWTVSPKEYIGRLYRYRDEIGQMVWAAPQDWMCEPIIINGGTANRQRFAGTHLSVAEHQRRTVINLLQLRELGPDLPIVATIQGFERDDYLRCMELYWTLGRIDLTAEPVVAVGSICRRQGTSEACDILTALNRAGLKRLHGFGFKLEGLRDHGHLLTSADSMAWSLQARFEGLRLDGCAHRGPCNNCAAWAHHWRDRVTATFANSHLRQPDREGDQK